MRPRKGYAAICSRCHRAAPGYDQLAERCFEFIPLLRVLRLPAAHDAARGCRRRRLGRWRTHSLTKAYRLFLARWARRLAGKESAEAFPALPGTGFSTPSSTSSTGGSNTVRWVGSTPAAAPKRTVRGRAALETDNRRVDAKQAATTAVAKLPWRDSALKLLVQQQAAVAGRATRSVIPIAAPLSLPRTACQDRPVRRR